MTTLGEFHEQVATHLKRGTSMDDVIPGLVRRAALFLERNYNFLYMEKFWEFSIVAEDRHVVLPNGRIKGIHFLRWVPEDVADPEFLYVKKINPKDQTYWSSGIPTGYWRDGDSGLIFDAYASEPLNGEIQMAEVSGWSGDENFTHWLLTNAEDLLLLQTLLNAGLYQRDAAMIAAFKTLRDEALKVAIDSDVEERGSNTENSMLFIPEYAR